MKTLIALLGVISIWATAATIGAIHYERRVHKLIAVSHETEKGLNEVTNNLRELGGRIEAQSQEAERQQAVMKAGLNVAQAGLKIAQVDCEQKIKAADDYDRAVFDFILPYFEVLKKDAITRADNSTRAKLYSCWTAELLATKKAGSGTDRLTSLIHGTSEFFEIAGYPKPIPDPAK